MLVLWLGGKQWPPGLPRLREPLPGCAAPSPIRESDGSRPSWRSGGAAAAAADSSGSGHLSLSSLSLTQTSQLQLSSIAIGLTQCAGTSGERLAHWLRGARRSCSDYHISAPASPRATARSASPRERIRPSEATSLPGRPMAPAPRPPASLSSAPSLRLPGRAASRRAAPAPRAPRVPLVRWLR